MITNIGHIGQFGEVASNRFYLNDGRIPIDIQYRSLDIC